MADRRYLSDAFLSQYEGVQPRNKGILFEITYLRTYSRWIPELKRRETWLETCARVTEYSVGLYQGPATKEELIAEAELMFDKMFNLEVLPAGRSMWIGGTEAGKKFAEANFNCSYLNIESIRDFCDVFALLLCGCGVGFGVREENVSKLPKFRTDIEVEHADYKPLLPSMREEYTGYNVDLAPGLITITIGDSKEAWVEALRLFLRLHEKSEAGYLFGLNPSRIVMNYDSIRPSGERINTFGGRAAGHNGLKEMFERLSELFKDTGGKLDSVAAMDVCNLIAKNVVVGGTRRSAQIALASPGDRHFMDAKLEVYPERRLLEDGTTFFGTPDPKKDQRSMSNNSVAYKSKPSREEIDYIFNNIKVNGDPGFFNQEAALKRRPNVEGLNPCAEILLDSYGVCNLSTVVISSHVKDGVLDQFALGESFRLATRIGMRQTNVTLSMPHWDTVQKRDRLTGVSMTGYMDALDACGIHFDSEASKMALEFWRWSANHEADIYADEMRIPRPLLVTAVKPEGTLSLLPTVSPGMHRGYAPYFIRRISVSAIDPVAKALIHLGVKFEGDATKNKSGRLKFVFPVKTNSSIPASAEPARDQFKRYLNFQKYYTDHNTSCTLTIGNDEWQEIAGLVHENWDDIVACAFLGKMEDSHPQLPYQRVSEEVYNEYAKDFPDLSELAKWVNYYEIEETEADLDEDAQCATGACPIR